MPSPPFSPSDGAPPAPLQQALEALRTAVQHHLQHPTAPDDDLRRAMQHVAATSRRERVSAQALMPLLDALLASLLPDDAVRRHRQAERLRHQLAAMCLRAYLELEEPAATRVARWLAERLTAARVSLAERWLERIGARVALDPSHVFPTDELLDHVPLLIAGIATYVADPRGALAPTDTVIAHARDLGGLRHAQGFDALEILKEFEILGGVLFAFATRALAEAGEAGDDVAGAPAEQVMACAHRLQHAVLLVQQATATRYLEALYARLDGREQALRAFEDATGGDGAPDTRRQRHVRLPRAVAEAARGVRAHAAATATRLRVARDLPDVEVPAAVVELALGAILTALIAAAVAARTARGASADAVPLTLAVRGALDPRLVGGPGDPLDELLVEVVATTRPADAGPAMMRDVSWNADALQVARQSLASVGARLVEGRTSRGHHLGFALPHRRREAPAAAAVAGAPVAPLAGPEHRTDVTGVAGGTDATAGA